MAISHLRPVDPSKDHHEGEPRGYKKTLTDEELFQFEASRMRLEALKADVKSLEASLEATQSDFIARIKAGSKVAKGWVAIIEHRIGPVRPKWKEEFLKVCSRVGLNPGLEVGRVTSSYTPPTHDVLVVGRKD